MVRGVVGPRDNSECRVLYSLDQEAVLVRKYQTYVVIT